MTNTVRKVKRLVGGKRKYSENNKRKGATAELVFMMQFTGLVTVLHSQIFLCTILMTKHVEPGSFSVDLKITVNNTIICSKIIKYTPRFVYKPGGGG